MLPWQLIQNKLYPQLPREPLSMTSDSWLGRMIRFESTKLILLIRPQPLLRDSYPHTSHVSRCSAFSPLWAWHPVLSWIMIAHIHLMIFQKSTALMTYCCVNSVPNNQISWSNHSVLGDKPKSAPQKFIRTRPGLVFMKHSRISEGFSSVTLLLVKWCCIVFVFMYSMKDWLFVLLQILSYMVACDRLCELGYDEAQVEEALEMFQNCETKVCIWLFLMCYHKSDSYAHQGCIYLIKNTVKENVFC